jgi:gliding motility-associated-like protein
VPNPSVQLMNDTTLCEMENKYIDIIANATPDVKYLWNTGSSEQKISINYASTFIVEVTDTNNCIAKDTIIVGEYCRPISVTMPTIFTPNNDGFNDYFEPIELSWEDRNYMLLNITKINFEVYTRWGQKVHSSNEILPNWDGMNYVGGSVPTGTYFWVLHYELINGEQYEKNGYVQLIGK